jgi:hypothetical protein
MVPAVESRRVSGRERIERLAIRFTLNPVLSR